MLYVWVGNTCKGVTAPNCIIYVVSFAKNDWMIFMTSTCEYYDQLFFLCRQPY